MAPVSRKQGTDFTPVLFVGKTLNYTRHPSYSQGHDWVFAWNSLLFMVILANIVKQNQFTVVNSCWRTHKFSSYAYINWFSWGQFSYTELLRGEIKKLELCNAQHYPQVDTLAHGIIIHAPGNGMPLRVLGGCLIN